MDKPSLIVAPLIEMADLTAKRYVNGNGEKTYEGLKEHITKRLSFLEQLFDSPLSSKQRRDITDIIAEEYKDKMETI